MSELPDWYQMTGVSVDHYHNWQILLPTTVISDRPQKTLIGASPKVMFPGLDN